jgi:hypothetical protein
LNGRACENKKDEPANLHSHAFLLRFLLRGS